MGWRRAFQVGRGYAKGVKVLMLYGGQSALEHGRAPHPAPKGCMVALKAAATV
jgi:hypothetical protein